MHGHRLADLGHVGGGMTGAIELSRRHRLYGAQETASPAVVRPSTRHAAVRADAETAYIAVFAPFTLFDADDHAPAVDITDLQRHHLGDAQSGPVGHAQRRRLVFE